MTMILDGSNGVTFNDASLQGAAASPYVLKNRIINGAMVIDQRNAGASTTLTNGYSLDRWQTQSSPASKATIQQNAGSVTPPVGFVNYAGITSTSAYSVAAGDYFNISQPIEGYNVSDLEWGTANAKTVTLSFWVRSSLTGTFGGSLRNSAADRSYPFSYTISVANTWEYKTVTIAGDTTGTWLKTNGNGLSVFFSVGAGSTFSGTVGAWATANYVSATGATSVVGTNGATFYITGVQLEQNTSATPFERRLYNQELANCQRYYWRAITGDNGVICLGAMYNTTQLYGVVQYPVTMRTTPSLDAASGTDRFLFIRNNTYDPFNSLTLGSESKPNAATIYNSTEISGTAGQAGYIQTAGASSYFGFSAEL
jgi:hypothetical protein